MPQFILGHGSPATAHAFVQLSPLAQGYIEAMFFTSTGTGDDGDLECATVEELSPVTMARILEDCGAFAQTYHADLTEAYEHPRIEYDAEQAGRDLWFTRNGHGAGFWDRDLGATGERLSNHARGLGSVDLYRGDDGLLYLA